MGKARVGVVYPWDDLKSGQSGAAKRTTTLINYLENCGLEVQVLQGGSEAYLRPVSFTKVVAHAISPAPLLARLFFRALCLYPAQRHILRVQLLRFFQPDSDRNYKLLLQSLIHWSDLIICEYPFDLKAIRNAGLQGKPLIVTCHDIIEGQVRGSWLVKAVTRLIEEQSLRKADYVIAVSHDDAQHLNNRGIPAVAVSHSITKAVVEVSDRFGGKVASHYGGKRVCLFVGSAHYPNIEAVRSIRAMAAACRAAKLAELFFVIVGSCAEPFEEVNIQALGKVDETFLESIYKEAFVVLNPLTEGTGSSVKTIEAFSFSKVIIGTSISYRGYDVADGENCIVSDNLESYPSIITRLSEENDLYNNISSGASAFADRLSADNLMKPYIELAFSSA